MHRFIYCPAWTLSSLGTVMVTLIALWVLDINARVWPLRKLKFRNSIEQHCKMDILPQTAAKMIKYRPGNLTPETVWVQSP